MNEQKVERIFGATVAGAGAVAVKLSAEFLFEVGGRKILTESAKQTLRQAVAGTAKGMLDTALPGGLGELAHEGVRKLSMATEALATSSVPARAITYVGGKASRRLALSATSNILKGATKAAGVGLVVDGVIGGIEATRAYRKGEMTKREAAAHVAKEAATGAVATGMGVAVAAGLVAVTGGLASPLVFAVGAGASMGAKRLLRRWVGLSRICAEERH